MWNTKIKNEGVYDWADFVPISWVMNWLFLIRPTVCHFMGGQKYENTVRKGQ
jgi:hypothetical protein